MPELQHLNGLDYGIVITYMVIMVGTGIYVSRFNRKTSDYFKGGGKIPWGLSAVSLFISGYSAYMFTAASGVAYRDGLSGWLLFSASCPAYLLGFFLYGRVWRRSRLDTPMQFLERRYSPVTKYFYTVISVIPQVLILGVLIYSLCLFATIAAGIQGETFDLGIARVSGLNLTMILTGLVLLIYTMFGGLWAVMVTDALQFLIVLIVTALMLPLAYMLLGDGSFTAGISRLASQAPEGFLNLGDLGRPGLFILAWMLHLTLGYNVNWHVAQRYYSVPDERDTRKMALFCSVTCVIMPLVWVAPVLAAKLVFPDLAALWPGMKNPGEASFVTMAMAVLPHGLLGLMLVAVFAATMSSTDTTLNWVSAVLTKDVFVPSWKRMTGGMPSERLQLWIGRCSVGLMGILAIGVAIVSAERGKGVFSVYLSLSSLYYAPMLIPVLLGIVLTRTPWWTGMASFAGGLLAILAGIVASNHALGIPLTAIEGFPRGTCIHLLGMELDRFTMNMLVGTLASSLIFFFSMFWNQRSGAFRGRIESFERDLETPAHCVAGEPMDVRALRAYQLAGGLALAIGVGLMVLAIPGIGGERSHLNLVAGIMSALVGVVVMGSIRRIGRGYESQKPRDDRGATR